MAAGSGTKALVFSAPPRETPAEGARIYQPIADWLSRVLEKKVVYRRPDNWLTYQTEMVRGSYDLLFDGPHFNSWRILNLHHNTLARLAEGHTFAVIVRKGNKQITDIAQLAGHKVCGMNPPNLGTLAILNQFDNPLRQPVIVNSLGWQRVYDGVMEKKCSAGILPIANLNQYDKSRRFSRALFTSKTLPNQAFSSGPRVTREDQLKIAAALTDPSAKPALARLLQAYGSTKGFVRATKEEYAGVDVYLKDVWGYAR